MKPDTSRQTRILVVTPHYAPDLGPSAPIMTGLCEDLAQSGYSVSVITAFPHFGQVRVWDEYRGALFRTEHRQGVLVARSYVWARKATMGQRLLYHSSLNALGLVNTLRLPRPDVVVAEGPVLWSGLSLLARGVFGYVPFIYVVQDIYPDIAVRLGALTNRRLIRWFDAVERFFYDRCSYVTVLSDGLKATLAGKGVPPSKIVVIPPCVDVDFIRPVPEGSKFRRAWGLERKFVVLFTATLGIPQGLQTVVRAAHILRDEENIAIVFVGEGPAKPELQALTRELGLRNVQFQPLQSREDVPAVFGLADVALVSLRREVVAEAVPSKTYCIMASGRPLIATVQPETEVARLIACSGAGLRVDPGDPGALAAAVLELYRSPKLRESMGRRGREYVCKFCTRRVGTRRYQELIERLAPAQSGLASGEKGKSTSCVELRE